MDARNSGNNGVVGSLSIFGNDVANLIELQAKLAAYDLEECKGRIIRPMIGLGVGAVFALGAVPVLLIGLATVLTQATALNPGVSLLILGGGTLLAATTGAYFALVGVTRSTQSFRRSREELIRNLAWLRTVVIHSGRA